MTPTPLARVVLSVIGFYRRAISPTRPACCRFTPSCSEYTFVAIARFGLIRGSYLGLQRLLCCHPWHRGGSDPVPETFTMTRRGADSITRRHADSVTRLHAKPVVAPVHHLGAYHAPSALTAGRNHCA